MPDLSAFPIATRWPARHPDRLQLYSWPTPNGVKVSIMLEEIGLPYEAHAVNIGKNESWTPEFLSLNPTGRSRPSSIRTGLAAGRSGCSNPARSCSTSPRRPASSCRTIPRSATRPSNGCSSRWRRSAPCSVSSGSSINSPAARSPTSVRWSAIARRRKRLFGVLDERLAGRDWIMGDVYTIADISLVGWVRNLVGFYDARDLVDFDRLTQVPAWLERGLSRPAVQRGLEIPARS